MGQQCCGNNDFDGTTRGYRQALVAVIVANSSPLNIAVVGLSVVGIFAILALRGTDTE